VFCSLFSAETTTHTFDSPFSIPTYSNSPVVQYIANKILKINEYKRLSDPPPTNPAKLALSDEEIFQTAKLIKYVYIFGFFFFAPN